MVAAITVWEEPSRWGFVGEPAHGRDQITVSVAEIRVFAAVLALLVTALVIVPSLSYALVISGTMKVLPCTRRPCTIPPVYHFTRMPTP